MSQLPAKLQKLKVITFDVAVINVVVFSRVHATLLAALSVGWSVGLSVGPSVGLSLFTKHATYGDRPC